MKLPSKLCNDRSNGLRYIDIWVFGVHFRPPSWIFCQTGSELLFLVSNDGPKLRWKFHHDRSKGLQQIEIWVFWRLFPAAILDYLRNRKWIVFAWFLMLVRSFGENFVMIGQTVSDILRFKCLALISGRHLGFSVRPQVNCFSPVPNDGRKLRWKFHHDLSNGL